MSTKPRTRKFQAHTPKLLDLMIHSVYSRKDVFLRELISNASDAIDKLRFQALTDDSLRDVDLQPKIKLTADEGAGTLTVHDNGIGMTEDEVVENLGTIARSGSAAFAEAAAAAEGGAPNADLIGQFGVGFYSVFMVADEAIVVTQKHGADHAVRWRSTGGETYTVERIPPRERGTSITLKLKHEVDEAAPDDDPYGDEAPAKAFTQTWTLRKIVKEHSDFIAYPIVVDVPREEAVKDDDGKPVPGAEPRRWTEEETLNSMRPLWTRRKDEITAEEYDEFYHHITHDWNDPFEVIHAHIEGVHEYTALMYVPGQAPLDLYAREHRRGLQLYAKRVFIMEECRELMPEHLRFVRGLVDSPDLPLNISREMVQQDRLIAAFRRQLGRRVLDALKARMERDRDAYEAFWTHFGAVLKEGFHYEPAHADMLRSLLLYRSTAGSGWTTLAEYIERMPEGQSDIYYLAGDSVARLHDAPQIEAFRSRGVEVLLMTDAVDEIVAVQIGDVDGKRLKDVARGEIDVSDIGAKPGDGADAGAGGEAAAIETPGGAPAHAGPAPENLRPMLDHLQSLLADDVEAVRVSKRLTDSAVCLVSPEGGMTPQIEQMMRAMGQAVPKQKRVLEVNPGHALIHRLYAIHQVNPTDPRLREFAEMLLDQALLAEGAPVQHPARFAQRVADLMAKAMG